MCGLEYSVFANHPQPHFEGFANHLFTTIYLLWVTDVGRVGWIPMKKKAIHGAYGIGSGKMKNDTFVKK